MSARFCRSATRIAYRDKASASLAPDSDLDRYLEASFPILERHIPSPFRDVTKSPTAATQLSHTRRLPGGSQARPRCWASGRMRRDDGSRHSGLIIPESSERTLPRNLLV